MPTGVRTEEKSSSSLLRALSYPNYRLFFAGQLVSLCGTWISQVATSWLVYRLAAESMPGRSAIVLGVVGFAGQIPVFLLSPVAGVWVDRWRRRDCLIATQALSMLQSFTLAFLALRGIVTIPEIVLLNMVQGVINAIDLPARQSLVVRLVDAADLSNAIALSSSMVHAARLLGPALAGWLIYQVGEGYCFLIDGVSYLAVLLALLAMRVEEPPLASQVTRVWHSLREGVHYAWSFEPIRWLLFTVAIISLVSTSLSVLMPLIAAERLQGNERTLGLLLGASGLGALGGSLYLASRRSVLGLGRVIGAAGAVLGASLMGVAFSSHLPATLFFLVLSGAALVVQMASCNTVLQTIVEDDKRGRVMSLFTMAFMGMAPFGSLLGGFLSNVASPGLSLVISGTIGILMAAGFARQLNRMRQFVRPIYMSKGILPWDHERT